MSTTFSMHDVTVNRVHNEIHKVLFDLDGTLADTAPDLASALNALRAEQGSPPLALEAIRCRVSEGSRALLQLAFGEDHSEAVFESFRRRFLEIYSTHLTRDTRLFSGIAEGLDALEQK